MQGPVFRSWAVRSRLLAFARHRKAFDESFCTRLAQAVLESPYLAESNLNERFARTRGFSVVFRREALPRVKEEFPSFAAYLDAVVDATSNAFFLNPLVADLVPDAPGGACVAPHVDRSLRSFTRPIEPPNPSRVTVLYAQIPPAMQGGELVIYARRIRIGRIRPRTGLLVEFRGDLRHEVTPARADEDPSTRTRATSRSRISLVCEHYQLDEELLKHVPTYTVHSRSSFDSFLEVELGRGTERAATPDVDAERRRKSLGVGANGSPPRRHPSSRAARVQSPRKHRQ